MRASSIRLRNSQRVSGSTKWACERIDLVVSEATGIHDGKVGPQAMADILIGGTQFMLEQLQGEQDAEGHGPSTTWGFFRETVCRNSARWR